MEGEDVALTFAKHIATVDYATIPKEVAESTKRSILDTLGVMVAGTGIEPGCRKVVELVKEAGGREESSILVFGGKVPAMMAAFANGAASHVLNYDDIAPASELHPTSPILPAALAVAERIGGVNGREFIAAVTLGIDLSARMGRAVIRRDTEGHKSGWHETPLFGTFSSAAVAGKLLGLDKDKLADALGIAFFQAAGSIQMVESVCGATYHRDAFPAKAGVLSALLAQRGISGIKDCLQSKNGLYNLYFKGDYDPSLLTDKLGGRFELLQMGNRLKPFPVCGTITTYVNATLDIVREYDIQPEDIVEIVVSVYNDWTRGLCEPLEKTRRPPDRMAASMSIPFSVATAAARRKLNIGSFTPEALKDPVTLAVAQRVKTEFDPEIIASMPIAARPGTVAIKTKSGESYSKRVDFAYGHPKNPMTTDDLIEKFRDCTSYAAKPIPKKNIERAIELILNLEEVHDIGEVVQLFTSRGRKI